MFLRSNRGPIVCVNTGKDNIKMDSKDLLFMTKQNESNLFNIYN